MADLKDMIDVISSISKGSAVTREKVMNARPNSIARMASEGTLQFPVLVSSSLDIDTAQNITKALERNYTTFVQTALSLFPSMRTDNGPITASSFIKQFHQNDSVPDSFDLIANLVENYDSVFEDENLIFESAIYSGSTKTITAMNKEQLIDLMESVRTDILNKKYVPKTEITYNFNNKDLNKKYNSLSEARTGDYDGYDLNWSKYELDFEKLDYQKDRDRDRDKFDKEKFDYQKDRDRDRDKFDKEKFDYQQHNDKVNRYSGDLLRNVLVDNDVKKANELIATTLHIKVRLIGPEGTDEGTVDFIIGVKCIMHPVRTEEMITNLVGACTNNDKVFNFFRWTTGEISFFKDFLFNIKDVKNDVARRKSGSSGWWLSLKKRSNMAKIKRNFMTKGQLLPNATIVINAEEAEYIKSQYGYDLFNPIFIDKIIDQYYLLGFVIVDNSAQVANFIFENDRKNYQAVTFSALEKAGTNDERKFKEMLKAVNRF